MLALLGSFMPISAVVPVHSALMLGTTVARAWLFREHIAWTITAPFVIGAAIGAPLGAKVYLTLPESIDTGSRSALFQEACREGVLYVPGEHCFAQEGAPRRRCAMRLSFGVQGPQRIRMGVEALARAIERSLENV